MPEITINVAKNDHDIEAVKQLCRDFVAWLMDEFPDRHEIFLAYFEPSKFEKVLANLAQIHARPKGAMLLARIDGEPMGCVMYHEMEPGIAEVKRLFVSIGGRGTGIGKSLVAQMLENIAHDGYKIARLDTANFLTSAIELYKNLGFQEQEPFADLLPEMREVAVFMEKQL